MAELTTARPRIAVAGACGVAAGVGLAFWTPWQVSVLGGWLATTTVFVALVWATIWGLDSEDTRTHARGEDNSRSAAEVLLVGACVASLIGVGFALVKAAREHGAAEAWLTAVAVATVVLSWATVHTVFTLRYADMYWEGSRGIEFNSDDDPDYRDFAYLAFTVGMTYQVSDTNIGDREIRRAILRHGLLSYLFGTVIVAMTINVVAGLVR